jgi:hypothetical protein
MAARRPSSRCSAETYRHVTGESEPANRQGDTLHTARHTHTHTSLVSFRSRSGRAESNTSSRTTGKSWLQLHSSLLCIAGHKRAHNAHPGTATQIAAAGRSAQCVRTTRAATARHKVSPLLQRAHGEVRHRDRWARRRMRLSKGGRKGKKRNKLSPSATEEGRLQPAG